MTKLSNTTNAATQPWVCPGCQATVDTLHCPACGEKVLQASDLSFMGLMRQVAQNLISVDSRLLRSLRMLTTRPGAITNVYVDGPRKPYIGPFQLFLIVNVAFFAVQSFSGWPIFSTTLASHLHGQDWSALAQSMVASKLSAAHMTLAAYTPVFDHAVDVNAKSLVIVLVVPFALLLIPMFHGSGRPFVTHIVFALHLLAFLLLCACALLLLTTVGGEVLRSTAADWTLFAVLLVVIATYLYVATTRSTGRAVLPARSRLPC